MAIIIAICSGCGKEVPMDIDTTEERFIGTLIKNGTTCEACILLRPNNECYCGPSIIGLYDEEQVKVNLAVDKMLKDLQPPPYLVDYENIDWEDFGTIKFIAGKPGSKLRIRRYKPLVLPTECKFTEGEVPKPYPKLEFEEVDVELDKEEK